MSRIQVRSFALLLRPSEYVCANCRKAGSDLSRSGTFRPLHASPALLLPRRRDFFSSNAVLGQRSQGTSEAVKEGETKTEKSDTGQPISKPKTRTSAAKTSLRRVAAEAQRFKQSSVNRQHSSDQSIPARPVTAYAVAGQFDLTKVDEIVRSQGFEPNPVDTGLYQQVVHVQVPLSSTHRTARTAPKDLLATEVGDVFIFPSGTVVTWALPEGFTSYFASRTLLPAVESLGASRFESEDLDYIEDPSRENSSIKGDTITLGTKEEAPSLNDDWQKDLILTKIAYSSGFARSTKLAVLETMLSDYFNSTRDIPTLLSKGSRLPYSRSFILRKTGQLLSLRAQLNLYSELTDSLPDIFWDSRYELGLEGYYDQVGRALDVNIRIKVLNEKMDYAQEIASVLRERLSEKHGHSLEWTIIVLIAVEIGLEVFRLWREGWLKDTHGNKDETHS